MIVRSLKTPIVTAKSQTIFELLDGAIDALDEKSVVVVTSKIISLCEGRVVPIADTDKEQLIKQESDYYLPATLSKYGYHFTITNNTLISVAGIDESNSGGDFYVLWPEDTQKTCNEIRAYLRKRFNLRHVGVIISDSTTMAMRRGTIGIPLAYSGFKSVNDYIGTPDLFGRDFKVSRGGIAMGLAAAGVLSMGEGTEQTPVAVITDVPFVHFVDDDPTKKELAEEFYIQRYQDDLYEPFLRKMGWQPGGKQPE
jgi:dihydrofolate synthase / folylpolyglutamate synthase